MSHDSSVDDLCLYGPWNNLALFYADYQLSNSLISLGKIEGINEVIKELDSFTAVLEIRGENE